MHHPYLRRKSLVEQKARLCDWILGKSRIPGPTRQLEEALLKLPKGVIQK